MQKQKKTSKQITCQYCTKRFTDTIDPQKKQGRPFKKYCTPNCKRRAKYLRWCLHTKTPPSYITQTDTAYLHRIKKTNENNNTGIIHQ